ncbi:Protein of unkown function DUF2303 [uncultured Caudovirales phage]|uniref:Protein of unkown function DUF2303 n=1 Tax=uncultured Caudovirales phage TaxID=2100421 RepID=A0A6J5LRD1_9CAUD|nr:Protein of unkown function DUF2303 [uncultured Caudovirales phage]
MTSPEPTEPTWATTTVSYDVDSDVLETAVLNAITATEAQPIGDYGRAVLVPAGYTLRELDERTWSDPQLPHHIEQNTCFVGVESLAAYVNRYRTENTLGYLRDPIGLGPAALTADQRIGHYVLDDHPVNSTAFRTHQATLVLRPTAAARRWGKALAADHVDQETLLDLVVDGIAEIATPDGAVLRDLVADLHAIRTTSARSVLRTGGQATVEVADNVTLHAGTGNQVTVPEAMTVVFQPYAGVDSIITLTIKIKPRITRDERVHFLLDAPGLDDQLAATIRQVRAELDEYTEITPLWIP